MVKQRLEKNYLVQKYLRQAIDTILLAGIVILFIGIYYYVIKAGIPYQDATLELQLQYAVNMGIGEILVRNGFLIFICGGIARLLLALISKKNKGKFVGKKIIFHN